MRSMEAVAEDPTLVSHWLTITVPLRAHLSSTWFEIPEARATLATSAAVSSGVLTNIATTATSTAAGLIPCAIGCAAQLKYMRLVQLWDRKFLFNYRNVCFVW